MNEFVGLLCWTGIVTIVSFSIGWLVCMFNGYYEYKTDKIKQQQCNHDHFYREDRWTEVIYNSELAKSSTVYKFTCASCGLVKYKSVIEEKDS